MLINSLYRKNIFIILLYRSPPRSHWPLYRGSTVVGIYHILALVGPVSKFHVKYVLFFCRLSVLVKHNSVFKKSSSESERMCDKEFDLEIIPVYKFA